MASFTLGHLDGLTQCHSLDCCPPVTALWSLRYPPPPVHNTMLLNTNKNTLQEKLVKMFIGKKDVSTFYIFSRYNSIRILLKCHNIAMARSSTAGWIKTWESRCGQCGPCTLDPYAPQNICRDPFFSFNWFILTRTSDKPRQASSQTDEYCVDDQKTV